MRHSHRVSHRAGSLSINNGGDRRCRNARTAAVGEAKRFIAVIIFSACGGEGATAPGPVANVSLSTPNANVAVAEVRVLTPVFRDANGRAVPNVANVAWTSSDETIALVDGSGMVTGKGLGDVTITVAAEGAHASTVLHVQPDHFRLDPDILDLGIGESVQLTAVPVDFVGNAIPFTGTVTWGVVNPALASFDANTRTITGVAAGTTALAVTGAGTTTTRTIEVGVPTASDGTWRASVVRTHPQGSVGTHSYELRIAFGSVRSFRYSLESQYDPAHCQSSVATSSTPNVPVAAGHFDFVLATHTTSSATSPLTGVTGTAAASAIQLTHQSMRFAASEATNVLCPPGVNFQLSGVEVLGPFTVTLTKP